MVIDFSKHRFDDSRIKKLCVAGDRLEVVIENWRDEKENCCFQDVIGLVAFSVINSDLSHGTVSRCDPFLDQCCTTGQEAKDDYCCYTFFSAWSETPILKVVARSWKIEKCEDVLD